MSQSFDPQVLNPIITGIVEELVITKGPLLTTKPTEIAAKPIDEYEGRMRVKATDTFDVPVYIAETNFYLSQGDMKAHRTCGAMIIYMDIEVADKIFKAAGLQVPFDEDDGSMEALCGTLCQSFANAFKERLSAAGYVSLEFSPPAYYKNSIPEGVAFSKDQKEKQEISFFFLKHKALVIDWTLAPIPKK